MSQETNPQVIRLAPLAFAESPITAKATRKSGNIHWVHLIG